MSMLASHLEPKEEVLFKAHVRLVAYLYPLLLLGGLLMPGRTSALATTELALTSKRVLGKTGLMRRKTMAWPYPSVMVVRINQSPLGMLFDYGTITLTSTSDEKIIFRGIAEPFFVQMQIEEEIEKAVLGRTLSDSLKTSPV